MLYPSNVFNESLWAVILFMYILFIIYLTKRIFNYMVKRNVKTNVAIYYNRKLIHMLAGGVIALLVPYVFSSPLVPTVFALIIALILYIPHRKKNLLNWFQVSDNAYEVNFAISWGLSLLLVWLITNNPYYAIIPPLFISFGDAVTGIIRNGLYGVRTKSWYGNLGMI
ncbi:MAG: dolichol kinase, partial [Desulfurococcaceae archaeon]